VNKKDEVVKWLRAQLAKCEETTIELYSRAEMHGFSIEDIDRASLELNIFRHFSNRSPFIYWRLARVLPQFKDPSEYIDITGGLSSEEFVRRQRDEE
jgi:hypothetical protein